MNENEQIQLLLAACWETSGLLRAWDISTQRQAAREASRLFADVKTTGLSDRPPTADEEEDVDPGVPFDADDLEPPAEADQAQAMEGVLAAAMAAQAAVGQSAVGGSGSSAISGGSGSSAIGGSSGNSAIGSGGGVFISSAISGGSSTRCIQEEAEWEASGDGCIHGEAEPRRPNT